MNIHKYVVLRNPRRTPAPGLPELRSTSHDIDSDSTHSDLSVETLDLSDSEAKNLQRDPTVAASAPAVEFALHKPLEGESQSVPSEVAWGIKSVRADSSPCDGKGITVAILDTGIDRNHPAFAGTNIVEKDFTGEGNGDNNGHGTHCAGTVFGQAVQNCRIGVAPSIRCALIGKVLNKDGKGATNTIIEGLQWALKGGAHVISMSLGMDFPGLVERLRESGIPGRSATSMGLEARASSELNLHPKEEGST